MADEDDGDVTVLAAYFVERPASVLDRRHLLAVPAAIAVADDPCRDSVVAAARDDGTGDRHHPYGGELSRIRDVEAVGLAAGQHQRDRLRLRLRGVDDEVR